MQQQHRELPPGFFCSLIYIKQTGELLSLEDWANGKAAPGLQQDWAQHSRQQVFVCSCFVLGAVGLAHNKIVGTAAIGADSCSYCRPSMATHMGRVP